MPPADPTPVIHLLISTGPLAVRCGLKEKHAQHAQVTTLPERATCAECRRLQESCDCDARVRADAWATSGQRQDGDTWSCPACRRLYIHVCDEAEGCDWYRHLDGEEASRG